MRNGERKRESLFPHSNQSVVKYSRKAKARNSDIARLTGKPDQPRYTIIEVAVDRQEPMVLQR